MSLPHAIPHTKVSRKQENIHTARRLVSFAVFLAAAVSIISSSGGLTASAFQYHPLMMCCANVMALPEVINTVRYMKKGHISGSPLGPLIKRHQTVTAIFQFCIYSGVAAVEYTKWTKGYPHLTTPHACVGAISVFALLTQAVVGATLRYVISTEASCRPQVKKLHRLLSLTIGITGMLCLGGGLLGTPTAERMIPSFPARAILFLACPLMIGWAHA